MKCLAALCASLLMLSTADALEPGEDVPVHAGPASHGEVTVRRLHATRELAAEHAARTAASTNPNGVVLGYHGGRIMSHAVVKAIFWGPSWANQSYAGDKVTGIDALYRGLGGSNYQKTSDEYSGTNGSVGSALSYQGHVVDTSKAAGGADANVIFAEVCRQVASGRIAPDTAGDGYYPVYTDVKRGSEKYCAWHGAGVCNGVAMQFAFFFSLDGDPSCDAHDRSTTHSPGLAALANVSAHELSEARTDPGVPGGWSDASGAENGDKCAWTYNVNSVTLRDGGKWRLQGEWSNLAYDSGTGYPNAAGQRGCLDGH